MLEHYYALIMAGGGGTRLWPLSRQDHPKQTLKLGGDRTLFQMAVDRLLGLFPASHIFVVTSEQHARIFQEQGSQVPAENYIIEPSPKDTAAAIGLSSVVIKHHDPEAVVAVVTADHFIEEESRFLHVLRAAEPVANEGYLVTLGIHPTFPSTGFGYIQQGAYLGTYENIVVFMAESFEEKPDQVTAEKFVEGENHSWNSGMFIWRVDKVLAEFERQMPALYQTLSTIEKAWGKDDYAKVLSGLWDEVEKISIDFGIMEGAEKVAVIPAKGLGWNDVGSWGALFKVLQADADGNIINCENHLNLGSSNSLVHQDSEVERLIVTLGVDGLVIVDTGDVLLVCDKEKVQDVKQVVNLLQEKGKKEHL